MSLEKSTKNIENIIIKLLFEITLQIHFDIFNYERPFIINSSSLLNMVTTLQEKYNINPNTQSQSVELFLTNKFSNKEIVILVQNITVLKKKDSDFEYVDTLYLKQTNKLEQYIITIIIIFLNYLSSFPLSYFNKNIKEESSIIKLIRKAYTFDYRFINNFNNSKDLFLKNNSVFEKSELKFRINLEHCDLDINVIGLSNISEDLLTIIPSSKTQLQNYNIKSRYRLLSNNCDLRNKAKKYSNFSIVEDEVNNNDDSFNNKFTLSIPPPFNFQADEIQIFNKKKKTSDNSFQLISFNGKEELDVSTKSIKTFENNRKISDSIVNSVDLDSFFCFIKHSKNKILSIIEDDVDYSKKENNNNNTNYIKISFGNINLYNSFNDIFKNLDNIPNDK